MSARGEAIEMFECFAAPCAVLVVGDGAERSAAVAAREARESLLEWHRRFSRFIADSELSRLNRDPRHEVPASELMCRLAEAIRDAGESSGGLVDATLVDQIESAGYREDLTEPVALEHALAIAPPRRAAMPGRAGWRQLTVEHARGVISRPPGLKLDSGGLAKGLFADVLAERLASHEGFAINCAGDLALGGSGEIERPVKVASPFDGRTLHIFPCQRGGVATSGIGRRSWLDAEGAPAHHLLDPATGRPAFTGIVQVTALASSALGAEIRAKAALLSGPRRSAHWLTDGGVIVLDDGSHRVIEPPRTVTLGELSAFAHKPSSAVWEDR